MCFTFVHWGFYGNTRFLFVQKGVKCCIVGMFFFT